MIDRRTIGFRLAAWYTLILAGILLAAGVGVWFALRESIHATVDKDLRARLQSVQGYIERQMREGGQAQLAAEFDEDAMGGPSGGLQIVDASGAWIYRSPDARAWSWSPPRTGKLPPLGVTQTVTQQERSLRLLTAPVAVGVIQIGAPLDAFHEMLEDFSISALAASPVLLALAAAGGYWLSRRALRPVDVLVHTARRIGGDNLSARLPVPKTEDELRRLSLTLNEMLGRLDAAFEKTRQFSADASHELRTPVAVIQTTAEVISAKARSNEEHMAAWTRVLGQTNRMAAMIDDLLLLARADSQQIEPAQEKSDLSETLREVCTDMQLVAAKSGLTIGVEAPTSCPCPGHPEMLRRLISILLDNAIKYTPSGGKVDASLAVHDVFGRRTAILRVRDTGIGIAADELPFVFDRFYRTSKDRSRETGGAGLGLSIAQSIVTLHRGEIFVNSEVGSGTTVQVQFAL